MGSMEFDMLVYNTRDFHGYQKIIFLLKIIEDISKLIKMAESIEFTIIREVIKCIRPHSHSHNIGI
ncbi:MAG TPA: hypothetical protein VE548_01505 [Nitrososphaeraceae archaeon]|jgi:hypothetical protein|nr:hypothetical protein [Nitrososphaeraceae archaeon]